MFLLLFLIKFYMVILLCRLVSTNQELTFSPYGKIVAKLTDPLFNFLKIDKWKATKFIPYIIILGVFFSAVLGMLFTKTTFLGSLFLYIQNYLVFFMKFFIVCVILGNFTGNPSLSPYLTSFFRLGLPWVRFTRTFVPLNGGAIIYPAMVMIFIIYLILSSLTLFFGGLVLADSSAGLFSNEFRTGIILISLKTGLLSLVSLLVYAGWLIIIRALMSWIRAGAVDAIQIFIFALTEPILSPFRKIIPNIGMIDLSAFAAFIAINIVVSVLNYFINMI